MKQSYRHWNILAQALLWLCVSSLTLVAQADPDGVAEAATEAQSSERRMGAVVTFGKPAELRAEVSAETVLAIGASANVEGDVEQAVVAIFGDVHLDGRAREVVAMMGNVSLGSNAVVRRDVVAFGGRVEVADGAQVRGRIQPVDFDLPGLPGFEGLAHWLRECVFLLRPLSLNVLWVWVAMGVFALLYFLVALAFPRPVRLCVEELTHRPATTFFVGLLATVGGPVLFLVLLLTGIGIVVIPFLLAAVFFGALVGKVAMLQYIGGAPGRGFGFDTLNNPILSFVLGTVLMLVLYLVPVVGFLAYAVFSVWGLGAAVMAVFTGISRERPRPPTLGPTSGGPGGGIAQEEVPPVYSTSAFGAEAGQGSGVASPGSFANLAVVAPRAGFWERMGAAFLDLALLAIPLAVLGGWGLFVALAYFAGMWAWKGTTVGGIVLNHKIVREDGSAMTFLDALIRGLASLFSAVVFFLGFLWIGWDREKQGWHDKIAGTYVLRLPRSTPLLCL